MVINSVANSAQLSCLARSAILRYPIPCSPYTNILACLCVFRAVYSQIVWFNKAMPDRTDFRIMQLDRPFLLNGRNNTYHVANVIGTLSIKCMFNGSAIYEVE